MGWRRFSGEAHCPDVEKMQKDGDEGWERVTFSRVDRSTLPAQVQTFLALPSSQNLHSLLENYITCTIRAQRTSETLMNRRIWSGKVAFGRRNRVGV